MGSYLSKFCWLRTPVARRVNSLYYPRNSPPLRPSPGSALQDSPPECNLRVFPPPRRLAIRQARCSFLGVLPTVCWNGDQKKPVLRPKHCTTVRIPPPDKRRMLQHFLNSTLASAPRNSEGPRAKYSVQSTKEENKKETVEANYEVSLDGRSISSTLVPPSTNALEPCVQGTSALKDKERDVVQEDRLLPVCQEEKRRRLDAAVKGQLALKALWVHGVPEEFLPKPGSLKRCLSSQDSRGIPMPRRNAITSSYSSTQGLLPLEIWSDPTAPHSYSPASRLQKRLGRKAGEDLEGNSASAPLVTDDSQGGKVQATATGTQQDSLTSPPSPGSSAVSRRKFPLLLPRRGQQLTLPSGPQLGYSITSEDIDNEKKAFLEIINKVLEGKTHAACNSV